MKKILSVLTAVIIAAIAALSPSAYVSGGSYDFRYTDCSGAYHVVCSGSRASVDRYASVNRHADLTLSYNIGGVCGFNGRFVFICSDVPNNQLVVYVYSLDSDDLDSFCIYGAKIYGNTDFCCDNNYLYLENSDNSRELRKYSFSGSLVQTYSFANDITSAFCGYSSGAFINGGGTLYRISGSSFVSLSGDYASNDLFAASDDYVVSSSGSVYRVSGGLKKLFDTGSAVRGACVIGDTVYCSASSGIFGYDLNTGDKVSSYTNGSSPLSLYADGNSIISVTAGGSAGISRDSFIDLRIKSDTATQSGDNGGDSPTPLNKTVSSDVYNVSRDKLTISGISPGTTVAGFKSNMRYNSYSVALFRDGAEKKSGNVGTAMTAVFSSDSEKYSFELSVIGDLTGEGNVNSRDLKLLMDYMIGNADYNGVYLISSDLSGDGKIDVVDSAMLAKKY